MNDKFCLKLIAKYIELVSYTQSVAEQYSVANQHLEAALNYIKDLKLEIVTIAARQAESIPERKL